MLSSWIQPVTTASRWREFARTLVALRESHGAVKAQYSRLACVTGVTMAAHARIADAAARRAGTRLARDEVE